ncbi:hypothetical protein D3C85_1777410 [compost metagenome]
MQGTEVQGYAAINAWDGVAMGLPVGELAARHAVIPENGVDRPAACQRDHDQ